ncbi:hypothetical protein N7462_000495 [Penicillium macrosclerotiorum]|uniref:uncharacterized protein n=1 Tax=Penicillium macrosclerotiorum TaxID=303699 RepID=UPI00254828B9|nr:uncharacterized protein N7462_000495 [Penicillium macrosclerotiorum]KAJ5698490.1 hypothetical protein N7462_000495 [Penicillium macrosclerotiorum]
MYSLFTLPLLLGGSFAANANYCPLLGPAFPAPTEIGTDPTFLAATENLTATFTEGIHSGEYSGDSIAIQIFSGNDAYSAYTLSHTDSSIRNGSIGVQEVDEDTVFRIGSISKLWTMLLYMTFNGTRYFEEPISKYVPELRSRLNQTQRNIQINKVNWDEVTIGELASHQAGIPRDYAFMDLAFNANPVLTAEGLPMLNKTEHPACGSTSPCNRKQFFDGLLDLHPLAPTSSTPIYSNAGYQILGYALETIAQKPYHELLMERIIKPLNLTRSSYDIPHPHVAIVPSTLATSGFNLSIGDAGPAGGLYSSAKDLATLGRAILAHTLVDPAMTRRWMKPATHTASLQFSVGHPWEIVSFDDPRLMDLYTKSGDIGEYSAVIALSPDHNIGFTVLTAGPSSSSTSQIIAEKIADKMLPTFEKIAENQARQRFAGTYALKDGVSNSSISIVADNGPGLKITEWISNSVDMSQVFVKNLQLTDSSLLSMRLQPTSLEGPNRASFSAVIQGLNAKKGRGAILSACQTWLTMDSFIYGNVGMPEFEFNMNGAGEVEGLTPRALRFTLPKV